MLLYAFAACARHTCTGVAFRGPRARIKSGIDPERQCIPVRTLDGRTQTFENAHARALCVWHERPIDDRNGHVWGERNHAPVQQGRRANGFAEARFACARRRHNSAYDEI